MESKLVIKEPKCVLNDDGLLQNPVLVEYAMRVPDSSSKILTFGCSSLKHTITDIPDHRASFQVILQLNHGSSFSILQTSYWLVLPFFFKEWVVYPRLYHGISSVDLKINLKYIMGRQVLVGLVVRNPNTKDIWIGSTCLLGKPEKLIMHAVKDIGIKAALESKKSKHSGENIWLQYSCSSLTPDNFVFLPRKGHLLPKEKLSFEEDILEFGIMIIAVTKSPVIESVIAMRHLQLTLRFKDSFFFQKMKEENVTSVNKRDVAIVVYPEELRKETGPKLIERDFRCDWEYLS